MFVKPKLKQIIRDIHLWSGLVMGIFIFLICLSGTILTFQKDIEIFLHPTLQNISIPARGERPPIAEIIKKLEESSEGMAQRISISPDGSAPIQINIRTSSHDRRGKSFYVNPYTGEVLNNTQERSAFFFFFFRLHRWLLLEPEIGSIVVGGATLTFILLLFSGLYLWWPKTLPRLISSLKVRFNGSWKKINYDLHNTLGFYSFIVLLIMAASGLCWSFEWYRNGISTILGTRVFGDRREAPLTITPHPDKKSLEEIIKSSNLALPYEGTLTLVLPAKPDSALIVMKTPSSKFSINYTDKLQINPYDGKILRTIKFEDRPLGKKISSLIRHLHTGEFYGIISKLIYFITCLIATTLPITGTFIWFNKRKPKRIS